MSRKEVEGNVIGRIGQRGDEGKAKPSAGSNKVGDSKVGFIPAPANGQLRFHEMGHATNGDSSGSHDTGKGNQHGHAYGQHPEDTRKKGTLKEFARTKV
jgi:hypothetical protein